ncbi:MAG: Maf family protein [Coriobacteriales bacterium]|nr:Maf family protein [Actinomycetes bacterium]
MNPRRTRILLASASPRRRRLISWLGVDADVTHVTTPEDLSAGLVPSRLAMRIAQEKALAVPADDRLVLACDTIVVLDDAVLGKPADSGDARRMLRLLSGTEHSVMTGVALRAPASQAVVSFSVTTRVRMRELTEAEIDAWIAQGECLGCAGGYNIERHLASVDPDECFNNVAGLPLCHVYVALRNHEAGATVEGLTSPIARCDAALGRTCLLGPRVCEV